MATSFKRQEKDGIVYYTIPAFEETGLVVHAFTAKKGGVSKGTYESLNLSILTADEPEAVLENRRRVAAVLGIEVESLVGAHQVHQDAIYQVEEKDRGRGALEPATVIPGTDGLMTKEAGLALITFYADCVPVFFLDPVEKVIALAHAGWKGTVMKIAAQTVGALQKTYNAKPENILAAIGPSIGPCHYQVDAPVIAKVKEAFPKDWPELVTDLTASGHGQFNLWEANYRQLLQVGLPPGKITKADLCTYCLKEEFFSHRSGQAGRQGALIMLK